jgi:hypothetical protein
MIRVSRYARRVLASTVRLGLDDDALGVAAGHDVGGGERTRGRFDTMSWRAVPRSAGEWGACGASVVVTPQVPCRPAAGTPPDPRDFPQFLAGAGVAPSLHS